MKTEALNLFIVDDNELMATALEQHLIKKFGNELQIFTFADGESCLKKVNDDTHIVILDYFLEGQNGLEILKSIKEINPNTEVIMLSNNEDMIVAIETFKAGARDYVIKGTGSWNRLTKLLYKIVTEPIRLIVREFGVSKFVAIFLLTFATMGIVVVLVLNFMRH